MVSGRSAPRATWYGLPLSSDSSCANSSVCFSMRSASLFISTPRCEAPILRHAPLSNAARAAATALSTSAASASATCVITSPVEGFMVGKVFPETLSTHFPLISSFVGPILTFRSNTVVAVAMVSSSCAFAAIARWVQGKPPQAPRDANVLRARSLYPRRDGGKEVWRVTPPLQWPIAIGVARQRYLAHSFLSPSCHLARIYILSRHAPVRLGRTKKQTQSDQAWSLV